LSRRILITGGAGFIGFHLASKLSSEPSDTVVLLDNYRRGADDEDLRTLAERPNIKLIRGDITESILFDSLSSGFDEVYHMAAVIGVANVLEYPADVIRVNGGGTLRLLDWYVNGGGEKLLLSSTSEVYAWTQNFHPLPIPTPEDVPLSITELDNPRSTYAGTKIFGELAVRNICNAAGKHHVAVRYHNVYGPRMGYNHVMPELYGRVRAGSDPLTVYSSGYSRAFCFVSDAVEATIAAIREPEASGKVLNIGNDREEITMGDLALMVIDIAGDGQTIVHETASNDPVERRCPDITRARGLLGYEPSVPLRTGLELTLKWYEKHPYSGENGRK
jgi:nucleoside-diphosphate-sugar epimerase